MEHYDPLDAQGQEEARSDSEIKGRLARETEEADIKWLMSSRRGRRIVWRLLDQSGVFRSSFSTVAMQMAFNEGHRNYGNRMLALVNTHCSELYHQMTKENTNGRGSDGNASRTNQ